MKFDCPRCGEAIKTKLMVGEFLDCENCNAHLKILSEDVAAVITGFVPETMRDEAVEWQQEDISQPAMAAGDRREGVTLLAACPQCGAALRIDSAVDGIILCQSCGNQFRITRDARLIPVMPSGPVAEKARISEGPHRLIRKSFPDEKTAGGQVNVPVVSLLHFTCPRCGGAISTRRGVGQAVKCHHCGTDLAILSEESVTILQSAEDDEATTSTFSRTDESSDSEGSQSEAEESSFESAPPALAQSFVDSPSPAETPAHPGIELPLDYLGMVRRWVIDLTLISAVVLALFLVTAEVNREVVIMHPIAAPIEIQNLGYTPDVLAARITDQLNLLVEELRTAVPPNPADRVTPQIPWPETIVAGKEGFPSPLIQALRRLVGSAPMEIAGEIIATGPVLCLTIRVSDSKLKPVHRRRDLYGTITDIDLVLDGAARFVLKTTRPGYFSGRRPDVSSTVGEYDYQVIPPSGFFADPDGMTAGEDGVSNPEALSDQASEPSSVVREKNN